MICVILTIKNKLCFLRLLVRKAKAVLISMPQYHRGLYATNLRAAALMLHHILTTENPGHSPPPGQFPSGHKPPGQVPFRTIPPPGQLPSRSIPPHISHNLVVIPVWSKKFAKNLIKANLCILWSMSTSEKVFIRSFISNNVMSSSWGCEDTPGDGLFRDARARLW